jgi:predicted DNA-binding transcriptional regulator AlpA
MNITDFIQKYTQSEMMTKHFIYSCNHFGFTEVEQIANADVATLERFRMYFGPVRWSVIESQIMRLKKRPIFEKLPRGTLFVLDYDDFTRVMDEVVEKVANKIKAAAPAPSSKDDDKELLTPKEVRTLFGVTDKTLHVWGKTGFLPRIKIGGVVRYRRADVERAVQIKGVH